MKALKWIGAVLFSASSVLVQAQDIPATQINDNYIGAGHHSDVNGSSSIYDIQNMVVQRTGTMLTVDIFTNFAGKNGYNGIEFGDLFMSTDLPVNLSGWKTSQESETDRYSRYNNNTTTNWNYAYELYESDRDNSTQGEGRLVSGFDNSNVRISNSSSHRNNQAVSLGGYSETHARYGDYNWHANNNKITFSFDVAGTALETATQIAFRWSMTCANDIIEGLVSIADDQSVEIPEPQSLMLLLLGFAGLALRKRTV
ncbi:PEP-CTERM sorting domain-containing protein [Thalassotalea sp. 1_MG-2023]|uniref:PEP-CTERM sorting domain-containing protein n=1 Tax=Thalassotalea sp. 1_MG-2023 TaxID=3062680 RepID=UPI0026E27648|nr:PEP-CTERM sorting domain-containing protein [Thalassotalea sp. 1_MG-2023]MDO6427833.1 PEP-CTERM sorting domain-containing protein [Thalassotalea sp. 1_MG-2023]